MPLNLKALTIELVKTLTFALKVGLANCKVNIEDPETIEGYVIVLAGNHIEPEMLVEARAAILGGEEFFPAPAAIVKHCLPIRDRVFKERKAQFWATLMPCIDANGTPMHALPSRVRNGLLLPPGDHSGDGSAAPELPPCERQALPQPSVSTEALEMVARIVDEEDVPRGALRPVSNLKR